MALTLPKAYESQLPTWSGVCPLGRKKSTSFGWTALKTKGSMMPHGYYGKADLEVQKQGYGVTCDPCRNATFFPRLRRLFMVFAVFSKYVSQKVTSNLDTLAWRGTCVCISYCYLQCIFVVFPRFSRVCFI